MPGRCKTFTIGFDDCGLRRGAACRRGRAPSRHRPHRAHRDGAAGARRHSAIAGMVRRAVCRFLADPDLSRLRDDAQARHGGAVRRRRRRTVRRLQPLSIDAAILARHVAAAARSTPGDGRRADQRFARSLVASVGVLAGAPAGADRRQAAQGRFRARASRRRRRLPAADHPLGARRGRCPERRNRKAFSGTLRSPRKCPRCSIACSCSTSSPICPTTS